jgi:starch synthase
MNEKGNEIRVFMPRFGVINERRHQLHEVIRLSGMNLVINDSDHPLIIKVASIPQVRMQVYFIDNEEYFKRKAVFKDDEENYFEDNDERSLFFCKGVLETVKKLGWKPDIIHCHGWMSSMVPVLVKKMFNEDPHFENSRLIYSAYSNDIQDQFDNALIEKFEYDEIAAEHVEVIRDASLINLHKLALQYADAVIVGDSKVDKSLDKAIADTEILTLEYSGEEGYESAYEEFYKMVFEQVEALV